MSSLLKSSALLLAVLASTFTLRDQEAEVGVGAVAEPEQQSAGGPLRRHPSTLCHAKDLALEGLLQLSQGQDQDLTTREFEHAYTIVDEGLARSQAGLEQARAAYSASGSDEDLLALLEVSLEQARHLARSEAFLNGDFAVLPYDPEFGTTLHMFPQVLAFYLLPLEGRQVVVVIENSPTTPQKRAHLALLEAKAALQPIALPARAGR